MSLLNLISEFPLEYCSARFLRQWETKEKILHESLSRRLDEKIIIDALGYFQIARSFKGINDEKSQVPSQLVSALTKINSSTSNAEAKVDELATDLQSQFNKYTLSAASKLLWLKHRSPVIIYDRRAVNALSKKAGHKKIKGNYLQFTRAWRDEYSYFERDIEAAIKNIKNGRSFMPKTDLSDRQIDGLSNDDWFKERVFDIFLWEIGV